MLTIAITGANGFVAQHFIRRLQENSIDSISEIRTIDRKSFSPIFSFANRIPWCITVVIWSKILADWRQFLPAVILLDVEKLNEDYMRDNLNATEKLLDAMFSANVQNLIFVGDAYANLPPGDNFGPSEVMHTNLESSFLLGHYGESVSRAEMCARKQVGKTLPNGETFQGLF
uniref:3-beta hydroxysteroid dehydrogenase/isomerase domain-containing protein n=1 Tax=Ditylenchus dipsaci TaxID=166011 RepID=A0A915EWK6_9BILA